MSVSIETIKAEDPIAGAKTFMDVLAAVIEDRQAVHKTIEQYTQAVADVQEAYASLGTARQIPGVLKQAEDKYSEAVELLKANQDRAAEIMQTAQMVVSNARAEADAAIDKADKKHKEAELVLRQAQQRLAEAGSSADSMLEDAQRVIDSKLTQLSAREAALDKREADLQAKETEVNAFSERLKNALSPVSS